MEGDGLGCSLLRLLLPAAVHAGGHSADTARTLARLLELGRVRCILVAVDGDAGRCSRVNSAASAQ